MKKADKPRRRPVEARLAFAFTTVFLSMSLLIVRLGYLQIKTSSQFVAQEHTNEYDTYAVPAPRGWIYDRNHVLLAADKPTFTVVYTRLATPLQNTNAIAKRLAPAFGESVKNLLQAMNAYNYANPQVTILQNASPRAVSYVEEHENSLIGVRVITTPLRYYPYGALADHVVGYIGPIPPNNAMPQYSKYPANALVGLDGIEQQYDSLLQGVPGVMRVQVNAANVPMKELGMYPAPMPGDNLVLNIDGHLQNVLQQALQTQVASLRSQGYSWVDSGVAVAMNPQTGAVLAMGSYPDYNPQWFVGGISNQHYAQYQNAALNMAVSGLFMPGSTEKPLTLMDALNLGAIKPTTTVWDPGYLLVGNTVLHEWVPGGFGMVTVPEALEYSSDVFLYQTGLWMGHYPPSYNINTWMTGERVKAFNQLASFGKYFGLTSPTQIDLPNERVGYFHDNGYLSDLAYMAIGQDQVYSAIGLAQYVSAIATGKRMKPEVLHQILSPTGEVIKTIQPVVLNKVPVSPANLSMIRQGMHWVTTKRMGTSWSVFLGDPYSVAGKTGTAQTGVVGHDIALFIGWAPYKNPKIAVAVIVPGAGEGYLSSGSVARKLIDAYLNELAGKKPIPPTPVHVG
ncbi:peptidoglycan D,D-transpeptidase FtsI family protein [Ferroacidibacillus organovorans]|uniref:Penicillin-binding protein 2 n=1 Tax=Ferroacidibacillus organovorans TaxID=1765683 RepID=A0A853KBZ6_9BACL|nr:penicillin-binding transpeptidase domain-containing protein [Ferroacidibacillus organovorans]KYP82047.1 hypothetical protein AYJ22_04920 [Ferroacidibacillus organovorans]OAG94367.1 hypothetical protein AYW79_05740 [Ferroacidibacillus organovorans]